MTRLGRTGRVFRWVGLIVCLLIVVAWAVSIPWSWRYLRRDAKPHVDLDHWAFEVALRFGCLVSGYNPYLGESEQGLRVHRRDAPWPEWLPYCDLPDGWDLSHAWVIVLPLWMPFVILAIPTVLLWWRDCRSIPPGHCQQCGYDLTGNVSGVCPECGVRRPEAKQRGRGCSC